MKKTRFRLPSGVTCLLVVLVIFGYLAAVMGLANMLNTMMKTAHDLLLNTCFFLMAICVLMGALSKVFIEFGVVNLIEKLLRPLMKPLFNLPGSASLGAVMTFLSDNPAIISLAHDKNFARYFKKYQFISLTNFGTAFGMGLIVIVFMMGCGYFYEPLVGLLGAFCGCIVSTRLMQRAVVKAYPNFKDENAVDDHDASGETVANEEKPAMFTRILNSLLDGGKSGVEVGLSIIPGVLVISTFVMMLTFGPSSSGVFTGSAYEGTEALPWLAEKIDFIFRWIFGFNDPHLVAFPITALGAVGAAVSLVPNFAAQGWIDSNAIAVFTAIGMCWSGFLSTHTAMLDSLGYRSLTSKAILSHTIGGLVAGISAHLFMMLISACVAIVPEKEPLYQIETTHGEIIVKLYNDTPIHRDNFKNLVNEHYFDSTLFYRIIPGFVNQFGDITTRDSSMIEDWGCGGKDYTLPAEILHDHVRGSLGAARYLDDINPERNSTGSDIYFVVCEENSKHLDGAYTVFGETVRGFDVLEAINSVPTDSLDRPREEARILSVKKIRRLPKED